MTDPILNILGEEIQPTDATPEVKTEEKEENKSVFTEDIKGSDEYKELSEKAGKAEEYSKNLINQRDAMNRKDAEIARLMADLATKNESKGEKKSEDYSKMNNEDYLKKVVGLSEDQIDDMSNTEIRQERKIHELENKQFIEAKAVGKKGNGVEFSTADVVKAKALELAGGDKEVANKILAKYNNFNNDGIDEATAIERVNDSVKLVEDYKAPVQASATAGAGAGGASKVEAKDKSTARVDAIVNDKNEDKNNFGF